MSSDLTDRLLGEMAKSHQCYRPMNECQIKPGDKIKAEIYIYINRSKYHTAIAPDESSSKSKPYKWAIDIPTSIP